MKVKMSWFVFIPVFLLVTGIKVMEMCGFNQLFGIMPAPYWSVSVVFIGFLICCILSAIDKKTCAAYLVHHNVWASLFSILAASAIASKSFLSILQSLLYTEYNALTLLTSFAGIIASVSFVSISLCHFQGKNFLPHMGMMFLSIPVWLCLLLIDSFLQGRVLSAVDIDPIRIFLCVYGMMFFLNLPMIISVIEGKNPVKNTIVYGLSFACLGILCCFNTIYGIVVDGFDYSNNILGFAFFFLSLYALLFISEVTKYVNSVDEIIYSFDSDRYEDESEFYGSTREEVVVMAENDNDEAPENFDYTVAEKEFGDFITEKSEEVIPEDIDDVHIDDILVAKDNVRRDDGAILVRKNAAEQFENQVLETNSPAIPNINVSDEGYSRSDFGVTYEEVLRELDKIDSSDNRDSMDKIDRLLLDLGSIDDI